MDAPMDATMVSLCEFIESLAAASCPNRRRRRPSTAYVDPRSPHVLFECAKPVCSLVQFGHRLATFGDFNDGTWAVAGVLMLRIFHTKELPINELTMHKLLITVMTVAAKGVQDDARLNSFYAELGGVSLQEINALESAFLKVLNFNVFVSQAGEEYRIMEVDLDFFNRLDEELPQKQARSRSLVTRPHFGPAPEGVPTPMSTLLQPPKRPPSVLSTPVQPDHVSGDASDPTLVQNTPPQDQGPEAPSVDPPLPPPDPSEPPVPSTNPVTTTDSLTTNTDMRGLCITAN